MTRLPQKTDVAAVKKTPTKKDEDLPEAKPGKKTPSKAAKVDDDVPEVKKTPAKKASAVKKKIVKKPANED